MDVHTQVGHGRDGGHAHGCSRQLLHNEVTKIHSVVPHDYFCCFPECMWIAVWELLLVVSVSQECSKSDDAELSVDVWTHAHHITDGQTDIEWQQHCLKELHEFKHIFEVSSLSSHNQLRLDVHPLSQCV